MHVGEICNRHAVIIGKEDTVYTAALFMRKNNAGYIVVVESIGGNNIPVGSLTDHDIVEKLVAANVDMRTVTTAEVMSAPLLLADEQDNVMTTLKRMRYKHVRHIPVVNTARALIGVLSIDDVIDMLAEQLVDVGYILSQEQYYPHQDKLA